MTESAGRRLRLAVQLLFFVSGATGLVYQIIWMRKLILVFGATAFAVSTVLTAFMGGLALGSYLFGRIADTGRRHLSLYGALEIGIGIYALAVPALLGALVPVYRWLWLQFEPGLMSFALLKFTGSFLVLVVPTTLMGATLPVLARWATRHPGHIGGSVGRLYALNTFGAVAGTFLCGFVLIRALGMHGATLLAAALNVALGLLSLALARRERRAGWLPAPGTEPAPAPSGLRPADAGGGRSWLLLTVYALSGAAALLLEVAWTRVLTLIIGGSVYAFSLMLTAFLLGLAAGAMALARLADAAGQRRPALLAGLLAGAGATSVATLWVFGRLPYLFARVFHATGGDEVLATGFKFVACVLVMFPATFLLGGVFPVIVRMHAAGLRHLGRAVGEAYAANTAGTIAGAFAGGFICIPLLGLQGTVLAAGTLELVLALVILAALGTGPWWRRGGLAAALALVLVALWPLRPAWNALLMNSGIYLYASDLPAGFDREVFREYTESAYRELFYQEGATATILVAEEKANGNVFLSVNGKVDASSGSDMQTQVLSGHLPALFHPDPGTALVVGLASGVTAGSLATHPLERIDVVEIEAAVVEASRYFDGVNNRPLEDPRVRAVVNDGRNYLLFTDQRYDIIISEPSNPWLTGAANLFTLEYFDLTARRLAPGGISCQWIQAYNMTLPDLQSLLATYASVFEHVLLFNLDGSDLLLLGSQRPLRFDTDALARRMSLLDVAIDLGRVRIRAVEDLLAWFSLGEVEIEGLARGAGLNTDDNARVEFAAPWSLFQETLAANTRALEAWRAAPEAYLDPKPGTAQDRAGFHRRLAAALLRRGAVEAALEQVERALALQPDDATRRLEEQIRDHLDG